MRTMPLSPEGPHLGGAVPLACVPLVASDGAEMLRQATIIRAHQPAPDAVEWRVDALPPTLLGTLPELLGQLKAALGALPLFFTNRSATEGGAVGWDETTRLASLMLAIRSGQVAAIDIELATAQAERDRILAAGKAAGVGVIVSAHTFTETPDDATMHAAFAALLASGGDAAKYAVMGTTPTDALRLLRVTAQVASTAPVPLIAAAMGAAGSITRLAGPFFGIAMTFATVGIASAPGQLPLALVRDYWHHAGLRA